MRRKKVIICVTNDLTTDQRVHKLANTLMHKAAFDIELIGPKLKQSTIVNRNYKTKRIHLITNP